MAEIPKVMLLIEKSRAFSRGLLRGIAKYSDLHSQWAFYQEPPFYMANSRKKKRTPDQMKNWGANGIIMCDTGETQEIIAMGLPTIVTDLRKEFSGAPIIKTDDITIGKMAAEYLLNLGFQEFAFCGFGTLFWSQARRGGFAETIKKAGFAVHFYKEPKSRVKRAWENEQIYMADWLKSLTKPVALMACNDDRGRQVLEACKIADLHVPEEVAILGVDNDEMVCDLSNPRLSSIALNLERSGYEAAELLDKLMTGKKKMANQKIIAQPTHVVTRQSTNILAIEDSDVAQAVRVIRQHSKEMLQVGDVARMVGISRRGLERRFRMALKRSVFNEIKRVRAEQVARMLVETNQSIGQIALALNYPGIEHISRFFRKEKGMSPLAYRKKYSST